MPGYFVTPEEQAARDEQARLLNGGAPPTLASRTDMQAAGPRRDIIGNVGQPTAEDQAMLAANPYKLPGAAPQAPLNPKFDVAAALKAGYTPQEIDQYMRQSAAPKPKGFDVAAAKAAGYTDAEIRAYQEKKAAPILGGTDPTGSFGENFLAGAGGRMMDLYRGTKQLLGVDKEQNQKDIDEAKRLDAPLKDTGGGMLGGAATDLLSTVIPGGAAVKAAGLVPRLLSASRLAPAAVRAGMIPVGGAMGGAAQSAFEPVASDETQTDKTEQGAIGGALGNVGGRLLARAVTPFRTTSAARTALVDTLEKNKVPVSAGQATGSPTIQSVEAALNSVPGAKSLMTAGSPEQTSSYTKALARQLGVGSEELTPEVMATADKKIGDVFERVGNANPAKLDTTFQDDLLKIADKAATMEGMVGHAPGEKAIDAAMGRYGKDPLTGKEYNLARSTLTSEASKAARAGDNAQAEILRGLRDVYDNFAERAWGKSGVWAQDETRGLAEARKQWGILKDLERPGVLTEEGLVNPQKLKQVVTAKNPAAMAEGTPKSEYDALSRAASVLKPGGPDSGTARNLMIAKLLLGGGGAAAGMYGWNNPEDAAKGLTGAGLALAVTQSKLGRKYMTNSVMNTDKGKILAEFLRHGGVGAGAGAYETP